MSNRRPRVIRAANRLGRGIQRLGIRASLSETSLVRAAQRRTGLSFFADEHFRVPLRVLLHSLSSEAQLHPVGRGLVRAGLVRSLCSHLRVQALRDRDPEILRLDVARPVFVVGLPRTGMTFLQRLLARHPGLRVPAAWEITNPVPFDVDSLPEGALDPRVRSAATVVRAFGYIAPELHGILGISAEEGGDDSVLFGPNLFAAAAEGAVNVPSFSGWLARAEARPAYEAFRELVQVLLRRGGGRFLGKSSFHLEHLGSLLATFPDAKIIHTHRDPVQTLASLCSVVTRARRMLSDAVDPHEVGRQGLDRSQYRIERGLADRARYAPDIFLDLRSEDLIADPLKQIQRVSDFIDEPLTEAGERAIRAFVRNPQTRPHHPYSIDDFGLRKEEVAERFSAYRERFDLR